MLRSGTSDVLEILRTRFTSTPEPDGARGSAPAQRWIVDGPGPGRRLAPVVRRGGGSGWATWS
ncbi:hypothetical protein [Streptomyces sp. AC550_RSS872]|uniref:hypothetical protein n=1 Tax=Streptomyces sp. AC550_RSS872 TaxID=2823689 RepID=UPI001C2696AE|nr:hypothetical protein [Streptomyces sp. AC550_RSS872]